METDRPAVSGADEVRLVLARERAPMNCAEILGRCRIYRTTTQIACSLLIDERAGLVAREGERGSFRYSLTREGEQAAAQPNAMRSRARRRMRGHRHIDVGVLVEATHG